MKTRTEALLKSLIVLWMTAVVLAGFLLDIPRISILEHTARNLYFHVPLWFALMAAFLVSAWYSAKFLSTEDLDYDVRASHAAMVGMAFGILGLVTGMVWARFTWYVGTNKWWNNDPKQVMAAVQLMIYGAYFVLRSSFDHNAKRARVSAVYNLFAAATVPFLLYVLPRQFQSLHPGAEGNPAFDEVTDPVMRLVFYPAIMGFIALFWWIYSQRVRLTLLERRLENE
ncbi:MAG TPA: cytochrome c biogenesis protein CcsA [Rhodothermales bacterium]|nr:cytochrome c biogenesis protein CcsA [Rhodothermales bacterium]